MAIRVRRMAMMRPRFPGEARVGKGAETEDGDTGGGELD